MHIIYYIEYIIELAIIRFWLYLYRVIYYDNMCEYATTYTALCLPRIDPITMHNIMRCGVIYRMVRRCDALLQVYAYRRIRYRRVDTVIRIHFKILSSPIKCINVLYPYRCVTRAEYLPATWHPRIHEMQSCTHVQNNIMIGNFLPFLAQINVIRY